VFEVISERIYAGVVLERMHAKGSNVSSGLLLAEDGAGAPSKLTFGPKDLAVSWLGLCFSVLSSTSIACWPAA
jgi:hypothetical protein